MLTEFLNTQTGMIVLIVLMIWTAIWKGFALWKAARKKQKAWFIVFLIFNTLALLEILYIFWFSNISFKKSEKKNIKSKKKSKK